MTGGLARPPLSPTGLQKRPICRTETNKKLQKDIYYFIAVILSLKTYPSNNYINIFYNIISLSLKVKSSNEVSNFNNILVFSHSG
jgi:hypothetical protein